jgi:hypothetical protein
MDEITNADLILSANRALLSEVRPYFRKVFVDYSKKESCITVYFYFDGPLSNEELDEDVSGIVLAQMIADFPQKLLWNDKVVILPFPMKIPNKGLCVYSRYEINKLENSGY